MQDEKFVITDDKKADWAVKKIAEENAERDRLISIAKAEIEELTAKIEAIENEYDGKTMYLKGLLLDYFNKVEHKQTKTKETYKLLNGTLVMRKAHSEFRHDDEKLLNYLKENNLAEEYVKTTEKVNWAELKKHLKTEVYEDEDNRVVVYEDTTGFIIDDGDGVSLEEVSEKFDVAV